LVHIDQRVQCMNDTVNTAADEKTAAEVYKRLLAKVRVIRDRRALSIADVFDKYGGPGIEREYKKVVREMNAELNGEG
jgi:hypothetical protein